MLDFKLMNRAIEELSVFFPAYNLESQIEKTVIRAFEEVPKYVKSYEIIVVNDGSTDKTSLVLSNLKKLYPDLRVINHSLNKGYGGALKSGFYNSKYAWVAFTDADGQFDIGDLPKLIKKQEETNADLVVGYYLKRQVPLTKIVTSQIWEGLVFVLFGLMVKDIDCGFKLISRKVIDNIPKLESERGAFISSELLVKAKKQKFKIVETGVRHYPRREGKGTGRDIKVIINSFRDLIRLWKKLQK